MQDYLKKKAIQFCVLFLIQLIGYAVLFVFVQLNYFEEYLTDIMIALSTIFFILDLIFVMWFLFHISKARAKSDVKAIDIVGKDIHEIYTFGKLGIVITDENHKIFWTNEWFPRSSSLLIDKDIFVWQPDLIELMNQSKNEDSSHKEPKKIKINSQIYEVEFIQNARIFLFKDITDIESISKFSNDHSPAVGIIAIDNYSDIAALLDDVTINDMLASVHKIVANYAKKYNLLVRKFRTDSYIVLCTRASYERMYEDKFSVVQKVHDEVESGDNDLTISIGFSVGFDDYVKLSDMASAALDVALSRGGDQTVISPYGGNFIFFGGKSEAKSKRSRVRSRVLSQSLMALIEDAEDIYIMGHMDADLDALGSCLGLYCFATRSGKKAHIVYEEDLIEAKTRKAFKKTFTKEEIKELTVTPQEALRMMKKESLLILTDVHRPSICLSREVVEKAKNIAIIDHHRRAEEFIDKPLFVHIEPSASSASELVAELIRYNEHHIEIPPHYATMMLAGIFLDTNFYRQKTSARTYDASLILKEYGADNQIADDFLKEEYEEYALKTRIMSNSSTPYYGVIISLADANDIIDRTILAIVAQETLSIKGVNACFVIGRTGEKEIRISSRSDGTINCQMLLEKLGGGGHYTASAAAFQEKTIEEVNEMLRNVLDQYLADARIEEKK